MSYITREEVIKILRQHQTETYPDGVGSVERCITPDSYGDIANAIVKKIITRYDE